MMEEPVFKKLKTGGIKQRLIAEREKNTYQSQLADYLLAQLAWGFLTTIQVQYLAFLCIQDLKTAGIDENQFPDLHGLAKAGTYGNNPQNVHRDINRTVQNRPTLKPFEVSLPFKDFPD